MRVHDWDEIKAGWSDRDSPEYRAEFQSARRELELGIQIRELRLAASMSQKELARIVGSSQPAIARLEAGGGMPKIETLERVAQALGAELVIGLRPVREPMPASPKQPARQVVAARKAALAAPGPAMVRAEAKVPAKAAAKATGVKTAAAKSPAGARVAAKATARPAAKKASCPAPKASPKVAKNSAASVKEAKPHRS
jgi:transcriptional regulator with XRE-family HTH domain